MAYEHESGLPDTYDRAKDQPSWQSVVYRGERIIQSAELNEAQTIARSRHQRVGALIAKDGDRVEGAAAVVDRDGEQVLLTPGRIYVQGDVFPVSLATIYDVPMTGRVEIGVRVTKTWIDNEDNPSLVGLVPGSIGEGEEGASREVITIAWDIGTSDSELPFIPIYVLQDGTIIDQSPPPSLSGFNQAIAVGDREANGPYIIEGCRVTALGKTGGSQLFSIQEGIARIYGYRFERRAALRHTEEEDWDLGEVAAESHTFVGSSPNVFSVSRPPIAAINTVLVTKQKTVDITRGASVHGADVLPDSSVTSIISVVQGGTTYVQTTSWLKTGDQVDWSPAGPEPAGGSSYSVTYRYRALVSADSFTDTTVTVSGGVNGTEVLIGYDHKLPRIDRLCLNSTGNSVYIKGVPAATMEKALPPIVSGDLLPLAQVKNSWMGRPEIVNDGVFRRTYAELDRLWNLVANHGRLIQLERIKSGIDAREPVAKKATFVDPFIDDFYRDAGEAQTAAVADGFMELAIDPTFFQASLTAPVMLDFVEEVIVRQELHTLCVKINPYQNFTPMPAAMTINPAADFWSVSQTDWLSPTTQEFNRGIRRDGGPLEATSIVDVQRGTRTEQLEFLRQIAISFRIEGFGAEEILSTLTFDGIDVKPAGTITANSEGVIEDDFVIPSNVTAGTKVIFAEGQGGSKATSFFVGQGTVTIATLQRITTVERWIQEQIVSSGGGGSITSPGDAWSPSTNTYADPQAQTFTVVEPRQLVGVDIKICAVGDEDNALLIQQVTVENGWPTSDVRAEAYVSMVGVTPGWKAARYALPTLTLPAPDAAFVVKTDDADHSIAMARLGDFDAAAQAYVGAQPYSVGVNLDSSNARTWTAHQERDVTFRLVAAKFTSNTKTVPLGTFNLVDASDLQVRAVVDLPSADCSVVFEIVRGNGEVWRLLPMQVLQLTEFITETVQLRAVLTGTEKLSPVLYAPVWLVSGKIRTSGTYICRAFKLGSAVQLTSYVKAFLPSGSTVTLEYDKADDTWISLPLDSTEVLSFPGWTERKHKATGITAVEGRLKITITGGPAARPLLGDLGAAVM